MAKRVKSLKSVKNPKKGEIYEIVRRGRVIGFKYTGKKGFGMWKVVYNKKA